jgi:hypothetical protein
MFHADGWLLCDDDAIYKPVALIVAAAVCKYCEHSS